MTDYHLTISSFSGLLAVARHYRGRVTGPEAELCHGTTVHYNTPDNPGRKTCDEGHILSRRADWEVEESWTEPQYERWAAMHFEGDGPGQFLDQKRLIEVAIGRFKGELESHWWDEKALPGRPGDRLILGGGHYGEPDENTPKPDGIHAWGSVLAEIPRKKAENATSPGS